MNKLEIVVNGKYDVIIGDNHLKLNPVCLQDMIDLLEEQKEKMINDLIKFKFDSKTTLKELEKIRSLSIENINFQDVSSILRLFERKVKECYEFDINKLHQIINLKNFEIIVNYITNSFSDNPSQ